MTESHSAWHTPRKVWHISSILVMLVVFFAIKLLIPVYWPAVLLILVWAVFLKVLTFFYFLVKVLVVL